MIWGGYRHAPNPNFSSEFGPNGSGSGSGSVSEFGFGYHETNQVTSSVYVVIQAFLEVSRRSLTCLRFGQVRDRVRVRVRFFPKIINFFRLA